MKILIIIAVIAFIIYQIIQHKKDKERERQRAEERAKIIAERKKGGNPTFSTALPDGAAEYAEYKGTGMLVGADGKEYPNSALHLDHVAVCNLSGYEWDTERFEYSPIYGMLALEYHTKDFEERLQKYDALHETDVDNAFQGIYELGESYYYPTPGNDDLLHYMHYEVRYRKDWLRAMQGNGYYQNAYEFPVNASKALQWYEMSDAWYAKYREKVIGKGEATAIKMALCKLQAAHILSAGLYGVAKDTQRAKGLYGQVFQLAQHYSQEELSAEVICALIQGYPRNPEDYVTSAVNMMSDWACRSDLGLAMLIEYTQYASRLDKTMLAQSPKSLMELCADKAEENLYAGYLLSVAMLCGYGTDRDTRNGMRILHLAAEAGSVFAAYALWQLASDDPKGQENYKKALDALVGTICRENGHIRDLLKAEGKNITDAREIRIKEQLDKQDEIKRKEAYEKYSKALKEQVQVHENNSEPEFEFPKYIYDNAENPWELMNSGSDNASYYCQKTGETKMFYKSDFDVGSPSGFHRR